MRNDGSELNRAAFLGGSLAAIAAALPAATPAAAPPSTSVAPDEALARLVAGNARFVNADFPPLDRVAERRAAVAETQSPFAVILACSDSRVTPEFVFLQGIGQLFVTRVAGNYPDDVVTGSIEYAIEHLGSRLVMVLGHENCGAVKAVYQAVQKQEPLPTHLSSIERLVAPGLQAVVSAGGSTREAVEANVRAAAAALRGSAPVIAEQVAEKNVTVVGAVYQLGTGKVQIIE